MCGSAFLQRIDLIALSTVCDESENHRTESTEKTIRYWHRRFAYLITLSALTNAFGGIVRPICLAALRLTMNSNFFGCSTGMSAGFAPFKILSTKSAARRHKSA